MAHVHELEVGMMIEHERGFKGEIVEIEGTSSWSDVDVRITDAGTSTESVGYVYTGLAEYMTVINKFKVGDIVKGSKSSDDAYGYTTSKLTKAKVLEVKGTNTIKIKALEHVTRSLVDIPFTVSAQHFELVEEAEEEKGFKLGDIVTGLPSSDVRYGYTNTEMKRGLVINVGRTGTIRVKILEHSTAPHIVGDTFGVDAEYFTLVNRPTVDSLSTENEKLRTENRELEAKLGEVQDQVKELTTELASAKELKVSSEPISITVDGNTFQANSVSELESVMKMLTRISKLS